MSETPSHPTPCPQCGALLNLPGDADLATLRCPKCQSFLDAKPASPSESGPRPPHLQGSAHPQPPEQTSAFRIETEDSPAIRYRSAKPSWLKPAVLAPMFTVGLLLIGILVSLWIRFGPPNTAGTADTDDQIRTRIVGGRYQSPENWVDAATKSLRVGGLKIKVERLEVGPVLAKGGNQEIIESEGLELLQVYVSLRNESDIPIDYTSWYGNRFYVGDDEVTATLTDNQGHVLSMLVFEDTAGIYGHVPRAIIHPKETVQDSIVFELPSGTDSAIGPWKLELPQAAFGLAGSLGFRLTADLIRREPSLTPPPNDPATPDPADAQSP